jgi:micrococcal nuclease
LLRYVWVGDVMINGELVRQGYAHAVSFPPDVKYLDWLRQLQQEAKEDEIGLWAPQP